MKNNLCKWMVYACVFCFCVFVNFICLAGINIINPSHKMGKCSLRWTTITDWPKVYDEVLWWSHHWPGDTARQRVSGDINSPTSAIRFFSSVPAEGSWPKPEPPALHLTSAHLGRTLQTCHSHLKQWAKCLNTAHVRETRCKHAINLLDAKEEQWSLTPLELILRNAVNIILQRVIQDRISLLKQW